MKTAGAVEFEVQPLALCDEAAYIDARQRNHDHMIAAGEDSPQASSTDWRDQFLSKCTTSRLGLTADYGLITTDRLIGGAGLYFGEDAAFAYCWVDQQYEGRSVAYAALRTIIDKVAFTRHSIEKVILEIRPENARSQKLARRLGAVETRRILEAPEDIRQWELQRGQ